ncbi:response regulator [Paenibacillus alba]|uniref:LytR/AlgR family response regulator transcription factor n=1 Tax=Paenibacillus alba TaxID=1197127 RepID=UPI001562F94B|nr:response regulator [Paenibacillus alba]NQX69046.1 response regulator [Paenibacillus alba]
MLIDDEENTLEAFGALQVDVVFLDIQMPSILGIEVARWIREEMPHTQFVFITAYSEYAWKRSNSVRWLQNTVSRFERL